MDYKEKLTSFQKEKEYFVGIDSDGCAFPTMELKHKECFIPNIIKFWKLQSISKYAREIAEWVNLYSTFRGVNRFIALVKTVELLADRHEIKKANFPLPDLRDIQGFIDSGSPLSNDGLKEYLKEHSTSTLELALKWSLAVNGDIADMVHGVKPFPYVRESLEKLKDSADLIVVSATPVEALEKEWDEHNIAEYVKVIAGQEMGKKAEHLRLTANGKYEDGHVLMVGDAPGDHKAAESNNASFFPVRPGHEEESWEQFYKEVIDKFLNGEYEGDYKKKLIDDFYKLLPEIPYWK